MVEKWTAIAAAQPARSDRIHARLQPMVALIEAFSARFGQYRRPTAAPQRDVPPPTLPALVVPKPGAGSAAHLAALHNSVCKLMQLQGERVKQELKRLQNLKMQIEMLKKALTKEREDEVLMVVRRKNTFGVDEKCD